MNAPSGFKPLDADYRSRVQESFSRQKAMALIGASLSAVEPGRVEIALPYRDDLTQQKGFIHGGILGMIADTACGYAAFSLMPAGGSLVAHGQVIRPGRTLTVARAEVYADDGKHVATMQQTLMALPDRPDRPE
jgi:acyl-coenzyme A thioesterase PaaI-like protein